MSALSLAFGAIEVAEFNAHLAGLALINPTRRIDMGLATVPGVRSVQRWWLRRKRIIDGLERGLGPEQEPLSVFEEVRAWRQRARRGEHPVYDRLRQLQMPSLVLTDAGSDPNGEFGRRLQGLLGGRNRDFMHVPALPQPERALPLASTGKALVPEMNALLLQWLTTGALSESPAEDALVSA